MVVRWLAGALPVSALFVCAVCAACAGGFSDPNDGNPDGGDRGDDDGPAGLIDYEPSNITDDHLTVGTASIAFDDDVTINSDTGEITGPGAVGSLPVDSIFVFVEQGAGLPTLGVFSWANLTVAPGVVISVEGSNGLVFALNQSATISGIIEASGGRALAGSPGPGGYAGGDATLANGGGPGGGISLDNYDAGGGGGGHGALGGEGGRQENRPGGTAGLVAGDEINIPLLGGSGGGRGGANDDGGPGGGGGGAIQISARGEIRLGDGSGINVSGAGGIGGDNDRGGGGGGAGGAILLEAKFVVVDGILTANGGGAGAGANNGNKGADGMRGSFSDAPSPGGSGNGEGTAGGGGASAEIMAGQPGVAGNGNTGGGGGGSGRIYVRTREAASMAGLISPQSSIALGTL